jgi:serine phosphatase RsbU (regulator of sigma subunit)
MDLTLQGFLRGTEVKWRLQEGRHRLGRGSHNEILVSDASVSRAHAELTVQADRIEVSDLGSRNGTWVNDEAVHGRSEVRPGDRLRFGNVELTIRGAGAPASVDMLRTPAAAVLSDAEQVHGTLHLPWEEVQSQLRAGSILDRSLFHLVTEAGQLLVRPLPLAEIFDSVLDLVETLLPSRRILVLLLEGEERTPIVRAARPAGAQSHERLILSRTMMDSVVGGRSALLVTDAQADPRFRDHESIVAMDVRSALVAPLFDNESVIGLIYADTNDPRVLYDADQLKVFTMLANLVAVKITQTRLLEAEREKERMEQEMATAATIQKTLLPSTLPEVPSFEIFAHQEPCFEVAGDLYDAHRLADGTLLFTLGDVSGKGLGSALLMSHVIACLRVLYEDKLELANLIQRLHLQVLRSSGPTHFATLFFARLSPDGTRLDYVNAGHNPPYLVGPDASVLALEATGLPLGLLEGTQYESGSVAFPPGGLLCVFSDGIPEAEVLGEFYGEERLIEGLVTHRDLPLPELAEHILKDLQGFLGTTPAGDDITLFLIRRARGV